MKIFFILFFLIAQLHAVIAQDSLHQIGKEFRFQSDLGYNARGGISRGIGWLGRIDACLDIPTEKLKLWRGGNFFFNFMSTFGKPFSDLSGDLQVISNIEAQQLATFFELWYQQEFNRFRMKLGMIDLNTEFAFTDHSLALVNSSFGIQPTISANMPVSIFPVTALGGTISFRPSGSLQLAAGIFDGAPSIRTSYQPIPDIAIRNSEGVFVIGELKHDHIIRQYKGTIKAGGWIHTSDFIDHHEGHEYSENMGGYLILEQEIMRLGESNMFLWMKTGLAPRKCNIVRYFYGGGITLNGPAFPIAIDNISFGIARAVLCDHLFDFKNLGEANETVLELTIQKRFGFFSIQPDLQYIINPSGQQDRDNCLFLILRASVSF